MNIVLLLPRRLMRFFVCVLREGKCFVRVRMGEGETEYLEVHICRCALVSKIYPQVGAKGYPSIMASALLFGLLSIQMFSQYTTGFNAVPVRSGAHLNEFVEKMKVPGGKR